MRNEDLVVPRPVARTALRLFAFSRACDGRQRRNKQGAGEHGVAKVSKKRKWRRVRKGGERETFEQKFASKGWR